jgi:hypothetical protein
MEGGLLTQAMTVTVHLRNHIPETEHDLAETEHEAETDSEVDLRL